MFFIQHVFFCIQINSTKSIEVCKEITCVEPAEKGLFPQLLEINTPGCNEPSPTTTVMVPGTTTASMSSGTTIQSDILDHTNAWPVDTTTHYDSDITGSPTPPISTSTSPTTTVMVPGTTTTSMSSGTTTQSDILDHTNAWPVDTTTHYDRDLTGSPTPPISTSTVAESTTSQSETSTPIGQATTQVAEDHTNTRPVNTTTHYDSDLTGSPTPPISTSTVAESTTSQSETNTPVGQATTQVAEDHTNTWPVNTTTHYDSDLTGSPTPPIVDEGTTISGATTPGQGTAPPPTNGKFINPANRFLYAVKSWPA